MNLVPPEVVGVFLGAAVLGFVHGVEPGHGWPVAASYALTRPNAWLSGFAASLVLGVGHLISSIAVVVLFFVAKGYFDLANLGEPIRVAGVELGSPVSVVAGLLLVALGVREYRSWVGDGHGHQHDHGHAHDDDAGHGHGGDHAHDRTGSDGRERSSLDDVSDRGLVGIAGFAFALGFVHQEEIEIIALCAGSLYCLELMTVYAVAVVVSLVSVTLLLVASYARYEERIGRFLPYLPAVSAIVLVSMGLGFVVGVF